MVVLVKGETMETFDLVKEDSRFSLQAAVHPIRRWRAEITSTRGTDKKEARGGRDGERRTITVSDKDS